MTFTEYAEKRLSLEAQLIQSYEDELQQNAELEMAHAALTDALRENIAMTNRVHADAEDLRRGIKDSIACIEAEWRGGKP